jgi:hypothetical protein
VCVCVFCRSLDFGIFEVGLFLFFVFWIFFGGAELDSCLGCIFLEGCSGASSCSFFLLLKLQQNFQWGLLVCYVIAFVFPRAFVCDL